MITTRRPPPPFDFIVVTGFLGAGKTTVLNRVLREPAMAETLVLVNEFGEIGLDHLLIEKVAGDMLVMTSGCLCCSIRGDLVTTLEDVLRRYDNGRSTSFRRVVIETTGLANPAPLLHTIMTHPYLRLRFRLRAVVTLVDAIVGSATLDGHTEALKQAAMADRLILTKRDLVADNNSIEVLTARLRRLNPAASIVDCADVTPATLLSGPGYDPALRGADVAAWLAAEAYDSAQTPHHAHATAPHHNANRHDRRIRAFCLRHPDPVPPMAIALFTELLASAHGARLLRFKGLVGLDDDMTRPLIVHGVQHVMHPPVRLDSWPDNDRSSRLVFIVQDLDQVFIEGLWRAAIGEPQIDTSDLATRSTNPLAPLGGGLLV